MTRINQRYNEYCDYCTEVMKHCDSNWKTNCLETAQHILCACPFFNNLRKDIFQVYQLKTEKIHEMAKHMNGTINRIIKFFDKTKIFERPSPINKRDLSPNRIIKQGRKKRKNSSNKTTNSNKKKKSN